MGVRVRKHRGSPGVEGRGVVGGCGGCSECWVVPAWAGHMEDGGSLSVGGGICGRGREQAAAVAPKHAPSPPTHPSWARHLEARALPPPVPPPHTHTHRHLVLGGAEVDGSGGVEVVDAAGTEAQHGAAHRLDGGGAGQDDEVTP